ncbi:hypothetical protein EG832_00195 [bacterium]|nr:hypothetical protein [bacterium]
MTKMPSRIMPAPKAFARKSVNSAVLVSVKAFWNNSILPPRRTAAPAIANQMDFGRGSDPDRVHPPRRVRHPYAIAWRILSQPSIFGSGVGGAGSSDNQKIMRTQTTKTIYLQSLQVIREDMDIFGFSSLGISSVT